MNTLKSTGKAWDQLEKKVDRLVKTLFEQKVLAGMTVAVTQKGRLLLSKGYGYALVDGTRKRYPMHNSIFRFTPIQAVVGVLLALGLTASPIVSAEVVYVEVNTGGVIVPIGPDVEFISKSIDTLGPRTLVIHYFAECQVPRGHIEYDIVANKSPLAITAKQLPPTHDNLSALCSNDGLSAESALRAASVGTVVACVVPEAGKYVIKVRGHVEGVGPIGPGLVDDQSLVIEERPFSTNVTKCIVELPGGIAPSP